MPTYDYICDGCEHEFEAFESIKAEPQTICPECTEPKLRRKIGPGAAILFKGSGFYQTDYRSESYKKGAEGRPARRVVGQAVGIVIVDQGRIPQALNATGRRDDPGRCPICRGRLRSRRWPTCRASPSAPSDAG